MSASPVPIPRHLEDDRSAPVVPDGWLDGALPDLTHVVTEDDTPVDNFFQEFERRLLVCSLRDSWLGPGGGGRRFIVTSDVGVFQTATLPPIVPDVFVSLDVEVTAPLGTPESRSYFIWLYGKAPDVAIEIVSQTEGDEETRKMLRYAELGIAYYVIHDPMKRLSEEILRVYVLHGGQYVRQPSNLLDKLELRVGLWEGEFEGWHQTWLRWFDKDGKLLRTGYEIAEAERQRAEAERQRADVAAARVAALEQRLRDLGIEPGE